MPTFGARLQRLRMGKGLSQEELAKRLKISKSAVGMYERNDREPSFELTQRIVEFFGVSYDYMMGKTDEPVSYSDAEQRFMDDIERGLPLEEMVKQYAPTIDGREATPEEIEEAIKFIKAKRLLAKAQRLMELVDEDE